MSMRVRLAGIVVVLGSVLAGCTDLTPLQNQVKELQSQVAQLSQQEATTKSSADNAARSAQAAADAANGASSKADQALALAQSDKQSIDDLTEKMDRMFKRRLSK